MAFVSQSKRDIQLGFKIKANQFQVGPGSYNTQLNDEKKYHSAAPFTSTTSKKINTPKIILPGPGQYRLSNPIGKPNIKTYANSKSIIIKINSHLQTFASKQKRFKSHQNTVPGPGQYFYEEINTQKKIKKRNLSTKVKANSNSIINAPSIPKPSILNPKIMTQPSMSSDQVDKLLNSRKGNIVGVWGKDKVQRFSKKCYTELGPGKYNLDGNDSKDKSKKLSCNFLSNTVKSIFDTICYDTLNQNTLKERINYHFKSQNPAPGTYDLDQQNTHYLYNQQFKNTTFGSTNARFQKKIDERAELPFYNQDGEKKKSFNKKQVPFNTQTLRTDINKQKTLYPGPGDYQNNFTGNFHTIRPRIQNFGSFVSRPLFQEPQTQIVGPGYYSLEPKKRCNTLQTQSVIFKSKIPRLSTQPSKKLSLDNKFGVYDIQQEDISRKILQDKIYRENLNRIQCQKPPFDNQSPRFKHYEGQYQKALNIKEIIESHSHKLKERKEKIRQKLINESKSQIYEKKGCSIGRGGDRFLGPKKSPGVGDYSIRQKWTKKSYNIKYNKAQ